MTSFRSRPPAVTAMRERTSAFRDISVFAYAEKLFRSETVLTLVFIERHQGLGLHGELRSVLKNSAGERDESPPVPS